MALVATARGRTFDFSHAVGRSGFAAAPGFSFPNDIAVAKEGIVYLSNRPDGVQVFPRVAKIRIGAPGEEEYLLSIGKLGTEDGLFIWPSAVALDSDENVYVADDYLQRISIFDKEGAFLGKWGTPGSGPGELNGPCGLAFDKKDNLYLVDALNHRVQQFTREGVYLGGWGGFGSAEGEFNMPWGITIDDKGDVYVVDWKNHRVQKFGPDGTFQAQIGCPAPGAGELKYPSSYPRNISFSHLRRLEGAGTGELNHPCRVAVDGDGDVYVSDWANDRVQVYTPDGEFITSLYGEARQLSKWAQEAVEENPETLMMFRRARNPEEMWTLKMPTGIGIDHETNRIIICDYIRRRLQIYIKEKNYVDPPWNR